MALVIPIPYETPHGLVEAGDPVAFLTTHAGSPTFARGTYLGVSAQNTTKVVVEYDKTESMYTHPAFDGPVSFNRLYHWAGKNGGWTSQKNSAERVVVSVKKRKTLQLNRIIPARN